MEHTTAPPAWRAISPVSSVTVCAPYANFFVTLSNTWHSFLVEHGGAMDTHPPPGTPRYRRLGPDRYLASGPYVHSAARIAIEHVATARVDLSAQAVCFHDRDIDYLRSPRLSIRPL
jgi:hypothetical protein